ncbi:MAG: 50S ribosomal protein L32 [Phycisphaerae bacterium]
MVPARRKSKAMSRARRSHTALVARNVGACPQCGSAKLPHRACANCGFVNGKIALKIKTEEE